MSDNWEDVLPLIKTMIRLAMSLIGWVKWLIVRPNYLGQKLERLRLDSVVSDAEKCFALHQKRVSRNYTFALCRWTAILIWTFRFWFLHCLHFLAVVFTATRPIGGSPRGADQLVIGSLQHLIALTSLRPSVFGLLSANHPLKSSHNVDKSDNKLYCASFG